MARFATDWWSGLYEKIQQANVEEQGGSLNACDSVLQLSRPDQVGITFGTRRIVRMVKTALQRHSAPRNCLRCAGRC